MKIVALVLIALVAVPPGVLAQGQPPAPSAAIGAEPPAKLKPEELEQLVAPVALYPDALLAQVLMASTYPLEVVQADRWVKANPNVTGAPLEEAMQKQPWDPSVKSLATVPQVLAMMNDKLDWTQKLGDAFLAQQKDVLDSTQRLRAKAQAGGNLQTTAEQRVIVEPAPPPQTVVVQQAPPQIIKIEQANPQVVYVPTYNPAVVYGPWPYPAYPPPPPYYPPGYVAAASAISFGVGVAVGAALWGNCNWHGGNVNVNVNQYNTYNKTNIQNNNWQHNAQHRQGVPYRDQATAQQFGRGTRPGADSREAFRGRTEQGRQQLGQGGFDRGAGGAGRDRQGFGREGGPGGRQGVGDRGGIADRGGPGMSRQGGIGGGQGFGGGREAGAFQGLGHGSDVRASSQRGSQSRAGMGGAQAGGGRMGGGGHGRRR